MSGGYVAHDESPFKEWGWWPGVGMVPKLPDGQYADTRLDRAPPPTDIGPSGVCCSDCSMRTLEQVCDDCPRRRYRQSRWAAYAISSEQEETEPRSPWWKRWFTTKGTR